MNCNCKSYKKHLPPQICVVQLWRDSTSADLTGLETQQEEKVDLCKQNKIPSWTVVTGACIPYGRFHSILVPVITQNVGFYPTFSSGVNRQQQKLERGFNHSLLLS